MKYTKIYHALSGNANQKWTKIFDEIVDVDPEFAKTENAKFEMEGIKYELVEDKTPTDESHQQPTNETKPTGEEEASTTGAGTAAELQVDLNTPPISEQQN